MLSIWLKQHVNSLAGVPVIYMVSFFSLIDTLSQLTRCFCLRGVWPFMSFLLCCFVVSLSLFSVNRRKQKERIPVFSISLRIFHSLLCWCVCCCFECFHRMLLCIVELKQICIERELDGFNFKPFILGILHQLRGQPCFPSEIVCWCNCVFIHMCWAQWHVCVLVF